MARIIEVVPYDPGWKAEFEREAPRIAGALGENLIALYHTGSTAIPGIPAKPTIDFTGEVRDLALVDAQAPRLAELGYEARGELGIPGRRYFVRKGSGPLSEQHTHHLHLFERGHPDIERMLLFRDYLIAHPAEAQAYGQLKEALAQRFRLDGSGYTDAKAEFVQNILQKARAWRASDAPTSTV